MLSKKNGLGWRAAFVFLSLFLGSARDFYYRFWWWDVVLHTCSGVLLGIVGWTALFVLNQTDHLLLFSGTFAVFLGSGKSSSSPSTASGCT